MGVPEYCSMIRIQLTHAIGFWQARQLMERAAELRKQAQALADGSNPRVVAPSLQPASFNSLAASPTTNSAL